MMKTTFILSILLMSAFSTFAKSNQLALSYKEETIILKTSTGEIHGTLMLPVNAENTPVALIIAGSGPTDRNGNNPQMQNNSLRMLAEKLAENNIASIRYDKRYSGFDE